MSSKILILHRQSEQIQLMGGCQTEYKRQISGNGHRVWGLTHKNFNYSPSIVSISYLWDGRFLHRTITNGHMEEYQLEQYMGLMLGVRDSTELE